MSIVQFVNAMQQYSADVLFLAATVCIATSCIKKIIPASYKKYLTFAPFVFGCISFSLYMFFTDKNYDVFTVNTVYKGLQCGAAATVYYVLYEQFFRGKQYFTGITDTKQIATAGILSNIVVENYLYNVSAYIAKNVSNNINDIPYCMSICINTLHGKTLPKVTELDITMTARLIISTLATIK